MHTTLVRTPDGKMPYFPALDGVRAYCILLIMFDHLKAGGHTPGWLNGHLGVDLFFILSGFLITTLLQREKVFTGKIDLRAFYWRRAFRILPVYFVALLLYGIVLQAPAQAARWLQFKAALPYFIALLNEFAREPGHGSVFLHTWSLGVEEKFYLLWPPLFFILARTWRTRAAVLAAVVTILALSPLLGWSYLARAYFGLLMGCLLALALASGHARSIFNLLRRLPPWLSLTILLVGFAAEHLSKLLFPLFSLSAGIFLSSLLARRSWLTRLHQAPVMLWLGRRSYSMYLVHVLALNIFEARIHIDSGWKAALVLALSYALAAAAAQVLYRAVEQPARNFGRAVLARRHEVAVAI